MIHSSTTQPEKKMKPHKHAALIKAWADGADIDYRLDETWPWSTTNNPNWDYAGEFRIKPTIDFVANLRIRPEPKPDVIQFYRIEVDSNDYTVTTTRHASDNLCLTFDGKTGKLKAAKMLK